MIHMNRSKKTSKTIATLCSTLIPFHTTLSAITGYLNSAIFSTCPFLDDLTGLPHVVKVSSL